MQLATYLHCTLQNKKLQLLQDTTKCSTCTTATYPCNCRHAPPLPPYEPLVNNPTRRTATTAALLPPSRVVGSYHYLAPPSPPQAATRTMPPSPNSAPKSTLRSHCHHPPPWKPPRASTNLQTHAVSHGRYRRQPWSSSPSATPSLLRNSTCIASTMPCVFQTLDGFLISGSALCTTCLSLHPHSPQSLKCP